MGIFFNVHYNLLPSLWLLLLLITTTKSYAQIAETPYSSPPPPYYKMKQSPFKPSIAVVVGVLTTIFSITFLLLLYAKHCKTGLFSTTTTTTTTAPPPSTFRKNSGIDRTIIESLPVFRFNSLRGQKAEGLECAVCLNKFEPNEILRLLPKCKHAFHVECVDTWLDAHSTCPLCRYKVEPEDILLVTSVHDHNINNGPSFDQRKSCSINSTSSASVSVSSSPVKSRERIFSSGRHSSAGERGSSSLQIIVETPKEEKKARMSLDSWNNFYKKKCKSSTNSLLSTRKDATLLNNAKKEVAEVAEDTAEKRRLEHRIIISGNETAEGNMSASGTQYRWSDVEACDMLYLRSEMILSDSRRYCGSRRWTGEIESSRNGNGSGRRVINERSVSEMTGMSRFRSNEEERERQRQRKGARWLDWISQSQKSLPAAAAASTSTTSAT